MRQAFYLLLFFLLVSIVFITDLYASDDTANHQECGVFVILRAQRGHEDDLVPIVEAAALVARGEEGCIVYKTHRDCFDPAVITIFERWEDVAYYDRHVDNPAIVELGKKVAIILEDAVIRSIALER